MAPLFYTVHSALAQPLPAQSKTPDKRPFRTVSVPEDGRRVIVFFDYSCPFSARYHEPMAKWASTVPKQVQTIFIPVINVADIARKNELTIAANCFYAASTMASRDQMAKFSASIYESIGQGTMPLISKGIWIKALKDSGLNAQSFAKVLHRKESGLQLSFAVDKTIQYALTATPSIGIGGKYVITPDDVLGDEAMFFNILNGLTSEIL